MKKAEFHGYCAGCSERIEGKVVRVNPYGGTHGPNCRPYHPGHEPKRIVESWEKEACEKCGSPNAEEIPLHGYTETLCEGCARQESPHLFSDCSR